MILSDPHHFNPMNDSPFGSKIKHSDRVDVGMRSLMDTLEGSLGVDSFINTIDQHDMLILGTLNLTLIISKYVGSDAYGLVNDHFLQGNSPQRLRVSGKTAIGDNQNSAAKWIQYGIMWSKVK